LFLGIAEICQPSHGPVNQLGQVPLDKDRVLAGQANLSREAQLVAHKNRRADNQAGRERFVMAVAEPDRQAVVIVVLAISHLQQPKVPGTRRRMKAGLLLNEKVSCGNSPGFDKSLYQRWPSALFQMGHSEGASLSITPCLR
jgi:hypothetical protein